MRECSPPKPVMCHVSRVKCHMSHITCHVSHVTCHFFLFLFFSGQSGEAYWWRVCYQRGLPRLVSIFVSAPVYKRIGKTTTCSHGLLIFQIEKKNNMIVNILLVGMRFLVSLDY